MATQPVLTFRDPKNPVNIVSQLAYVFSTLGSNFLPVLQGYNSIPLQFRLYNNYNTASGIAAAMNINVTVFDGVGPGSHTASKLPVSQSWVHVYETGFGENSVPPGLYTAFPGSDTAVGGAPAGINAYFAEYGSDGTPSDQIRAGAGQSGVGFIEFGSYVSVPVGASTANWNFAMDVLYEWTP